jgi:hypothetical protein
MFAHHQLCWVHLLRKFRDLSGLKTYNEDIHLHCVETYKRIAELYKQLQNILNSEHNEIVRLQKKAKLTEEFKNVF